MQTPRIADYGVVGDGHAVALISRHGGVDWLCLPTFHSPALFSALLDRERGGALSLCPTTPFTASQTYVRDSNVLETSFHCASGTAVLTDCLTVPDPRSSELQPERELLRSIECREGEVTIRVRFAPRPGYGRAARLRRLGRIGWHCLYRGLSVIVQTSVPLEPAEEGVVTAQVQLGQGERFYLSLCYAEREICVLAPLDGADGRIERTIEWWRTWMRGLEPANGHDATDAAIRRSVLSLKTLTSSLTGATIGAPTTSLPEVIGGSGNWDYRYCWIRDSAFVVRAFTSLGFDAEGEAFMRWLLRTIPAPRARLEVLYDIWGKHRLKERELRQLEGHRGSRPVRTGNAASTHLQTDSYGELMCAVSDFVDAGGVLDRGERRLIANLGRRVLELWREPDNGIWEVRGQRRHHTYSKAMCWVALERLRRLNEPLSLGLSPPALDEGLDAIRDVVEREGFDRSVDSYVGTFGSSEADASLLLLAKFGYIEHDEPRMLGTWRHIQRTLTRGALVWRYRTEHADDGLPADEGAFLPCGFWAVEYLARLGERGAASARFDELLGCSSELGLLSEMVSDGGELLGNFPQALTHASLISSALALAAAEAPELRAAAAS